MAIVNYLRKPFGGENEHQATIALGLLIGMLTLEAGATDPESALAWLRVPASKGV
jgi:hypothetical protein